MHGDAHTWVLSCRPGRWLALGKAGDRVQTGLGGFLGRTWLISSWATSLAYCCVASESTAFMPPSGATGRPNKVSFRPYPNAAQL